MGGRGEDRVCLSLEDEDEGRGKLTSMSPTLDDGEVLSQPLRQVFEVMRLQE